MKIQTFANRTGLSVYTLRYYEQLGLLVPPRNAAGHRSYGQPEMDWVSFLKRLKDTGMPLEDMRRYAALRAEGDSTLLARRALLAQHAEALENRLAEQVRHLAALQQKIGYYDQQIDLH